MTATLDLKAKILSILNPIPVFSSKDVVLRLCKKNPVQIISLMLDPRLRADRILEKGVGNDRNPRFESKNPVSSQTGIQHQ
jgi:hypothetical protein